VIQPKDWPAPKGYANAIVASGEVVYIGGQIGWDGASVVSDELTEQFAKALDNIVVLLAEAGAKPEHVVRMTVFVTDMPAYRESARSLGAIWRQRFGKHYPAMALLGVSTLVEPRAKVEIEATAVISQSA
jgi:enamine deaminase RidA (YjgF/YER057c/UK114 family)